MARCSTAIESARKAGVDVIAFRSGGHNDRDLAGAIAIYDHPADLLARLDESPFAECVKRKLDAGA